MKHVFVFDPKSFYNQQWKMDGIFDNIGQFFRTQVMPDFSTQVARFRRDAIGIIQKEVESAKNGDIVRIYAIGGDEILYDCLNGVAMYPNTELAMVPHGETSDFLQIFGEGKKEAFKDIPSLVKSSTIPTDVISWDVNYALNSCYIGLNSATAIKLKEIKSKLNKGIFIIFSKLSSFFNYIATAFNKEIRFQRYNIIIDDKDFSGSYSLIHIANGPYYAGKMTGLKTAVPDDGFLDIALIKSAGPLKTMFSMRRYARGKKSSHCIIMKAKKILIESDKLMWIQLDNEYIRDTSININIIPKAVNMVVLNGLSYQKA